MMPAGVGVSTGGQSAAFIPPDYSSVHRDSGGDAADDAGWWCLLGQSGRIASHLSGQACRARMPVQRKCAKKCCLDAEGRERDGGLTLLPACVRVVCWV